MPRLRLLPTIMLCAALLFGFKAGQAYRDGRELFALAFSTPAHASDAEKEKEKEEEKDKEEKKSEEKEGEKKEGTEGEKSASEPAPAQDVTANMRPEERRFSPQELELLQQLSARREQLDQWEKNVAVKETLLSATEKRIDEKLVQMEAMKKELAALLVQYNDQEDAKLKSLVKIYENMKPRDAARIFDEVEMPILLLVIDRMKEKVAAPILAGMDAKKAKQLTVELAEQRKLEDEKIRASKAAAQAAQNQGAKPPAPKQ